MKSLLIFFISIFITAQLYSQNSIYFDFDYAVFRGEDDKNILEIYYSVNQKFLEYINNGKNFEAAAKIDISIYNKNISDTVFSNSYMAPSVVNDTNAEVFSKKLVGQLNYLLPTGDYKILLSGSDINNQDKIDKHEKDIMINEFLNLNLSDIVLSTQINKSNDENSIFYKNTLEVIPNPSTLYGRNLEDFYYYYEIYGLDDSKITDDYKIRYTILKNDNNSIVYKHDKKKSRLPGTEAIVDYGKFDVSHLQRGTYTFRVELVDDKENIKAVKTKTFYIFNEDLNVLNLASDDDVFLRSEYAIMTEEQLNREFEVTGYIRPDALNLNLDKMTLDEKRKLLFNFWKSKDPNILTPQNEFKIDYIKRVNEANQLFKESFREGWKTDRGRIYIVYGKPDDIEKFPFESNTKSHEIWIYNTVEGGGTNVFVERQPSSGAYSLIHSTFRNELRNDNWRLDISQ